MKRPARPRDFAQRAKLIVDIATGNASDPRPVPDNPEIAARRKGGIKGGKARATKLSALKRRQIARKAARTRWSK